MQTIARQRWGRLQFWFRSDTSQVEDVTAFLEIFGFGMLCAVEI
jgi:hypothetical protein